MVPKPHIVKQTTLNFQFAKADNNLAIPGKIEHWFMNGAQRQIETICDEIGLNGDYIEIDEIEIDLGSILERQFEGELDHLFYNELRKHLKSKIALQRADIGNMKEPSIVSANMLVEILSVFLEHGYLPWQSSFVSIAEFEDAILKSPKSLSFEVIKGINLLLRDLIVQQRLAYNFSGKFLMWLFSNVLNHLSIDSKFLSEMVIHTYDDKKKVTEIINQLLSGFYVNLSINRENSETKSAVLIKDSEINAKVENDDVSGDGIFVSNTGVVVMHPFLAPLFANLELIEDNIFINDKKREKAIWLLFFMVYGHLKMDESHVAFLKLLCGLSIKEPLYHIPELSEAEKREVEIVLEHAIKYWEVLKNTSIVTFRETFLQRNGHILIRDFIEVNVEQQGVDMLIGHLPWALSIISLPWMNKKIHVNWA